MVALVLAGINALLYHVITERRIAEWDGRDTSSGRGTPRRTHLDCDLGRGGVGWTHDFVHALLVTPHGCRCGRDSMSPADRSVALIA